MLFRSRYCAVVVNVGNYAGRRDRVRHRRDERVERPGVVIEPYEIERIAYVSISDADIGWKLRTAYQLRDG